MTLYLLDTDHISLVQRHHPQISAKILTVSPKQLAVSIITVQEQLRGRLAQVNEAKKNSDLVLAYRLLHETVTFYQRVQVIDFDNQAATIFDNFRQQKVGIGTLDLRIAATALAVGAIVVTRNRRDFEKVAGLTLEDWSIPTIN